MILTSAAGVYMAIGNLIHPLHNRIIYTAKPHEGNDAVPNRTIPDSKTNFVVQ